jgi:2-octaprenyl-6-methoxyphenol hydroxylase
MTEKTPAYNYDVVIAGAGMVGLSMAVAVARAGLPADLRVAVLERTSLCAQLEPEFDGRVCAISLGSKRILDAIGAWKFMAENAEPIWDIRVTDGATPFFLHYDHAEVGDEPVGFILENRHTRHGLQAVVATLPNITIIDNFAIKTLEQDAFSAKITSANGEVVAARLLIAADGRGSQIRELAGIGKTTWGYEQTAIVCTIEHELPHNGLAQERFLPAGPFAVLPMQGNRSSLVWVEPDDCVQIYMELPEEDFLQEISERVGKYLGKIISSSTRFSYPLSLLHAKKYTTNRVALVGDAAHGMHPIAGQGVNLGFRDVEVFAEIIRKQAALGLDVGGESLLTEYANLRRFDVVSMLASMDLLTRIFSNNYLPVRAARDVGLWAVGQMPPLKRFFMRHAMGTLGEKAEDTTKETVS